MSSKESYFKTGIALPTDENGQTDGIGTFTHTVLEDILYNIIHGIVLKTHREEKISRANSAAIIVLQKAEKALSTRISTESAIYKDSTITISGNPLEKLPASETRCPRCRLPRLLHPTSGNASQSPDPNIEYCTRHPFIDKPGHDIYGQVFPVDSRKGKKGKLEASDHPQPLGSSPPSLLPAGSTTTFPLVKCRCGRQVFIKRFAAHLGKCIGGRPSGRAAQLKMNGNSTTPPSSRRGTPSKKAKRELPEDFDSEGSPKKKRKKKRKIVKQTKKWKSGRQMINSNDSHVATSDDDDDDDDSLPNGTKSVSSQTLSSP